MKSILVTLNYLPAADIWLFGSQGFHWNSGQDFYILADDGMNITATQTNSNAPGTPTILISSSDLSTIDGARGLIFVAGLDAPDVKADFTATSAQYTLLETYDQLHVRAAAGHFKVDSGKNINIVTKEASEAKLTAAGDSTYTADQDMLYTTIDGDQFFDSNAFSMSASADRDVRLQVSNGPIQLKAIAGPFTMTSPLWEFTSQMDTRFASLGFTRINAGAGLRLISSAVNSDSEQCVLLQNYRKLDGITVNSLTDMTVTATTNDLTPLQTNSIQTFGDNIDFYALNGLSYTTTAPLYIGNQTSPVIRISGGEGAPAGVMIDSGTGLLARSQNSISALSTTQSYDAQNNMNLESTGLIYLISQAFATTWTAGVDLRLSGEFLTVDAVGNHVIDGAATGSVLFSSEGTSIGDRMELRTTGPVTTQSDVVPFTTSILYDFTLKGDMDVKSTESVSFQNDVPDDGNFARPFFSDIQSERGKILLTVGDTWNNNANDLEVTLGRFGTKFATNFTTGDFQQSSIDFNIAGQLTWNSKDFLVQAQYEGSTVDFQSTNFDLTSDTISLTSVVPAKTGGYIHVDPLESDIDFTSVGFLNINPSASATFTATLSTIYQESLAATTYSFTGDWTVDVLNADQDALVEFSSSENSVTMGNSKTTANLIFDSTTVGSPFTTDVDKLFRSLYSSDLDITFDFANTWTMDAGTGFIRDDSATVYLTPSNSIQSTAVGTFRLGTESYVSDINVDSTAALNLLPTVIGVVSSSDLLNIQGTTSSTFTGLDTQFNTEWGDITFDGATSLTMTAQGTSTFTANGFDEDRSRAFTVSTPLLTATAGGVMSFLAKQGIDINSPDSLTTFTAGNILMQSSNFVSPIVLNSLSNAVTFRTTTVNWHGGGSTLMEAHQITLTANTALTVKSGPASTIRDAGILFDTNPKQNMDSSISMVGTTATHQANWLTITTDFTSADDGGININTFALGALGFTATDRLDLLNKHGDMVLDLVTTNIGNIAATVSLTAGSHDWSLGTSTWGATGQFLVRSGESVFFPGQALASTLVDITFATKDFGRSNDVYFRSTVSSAVTATAALEFKGSGSDTDIVVESDLAGTVTIGTAANSPTVSFFSRSGISVVTSESTTTTSISLTTTSTWLTHSSEWKANIFFQSDRDTIFNAAEIRHSNYQSLLGFFSASPASIYLVNLQGLEGCSRVGYCGYQFTHDPIWTSAIRNVEYVGWNLQEYLRSWGLIDWTTFLDHVTTYP